MGDSRVGVLCAVGAVGAWAAKGVAIAVAGGLGRSPLEDPLFYLGLVLLALAFASLGLALAERRPQAVRLVVVIVTVGVGVAMTALVQSLVVAAMPGSAGWVREEAGLWAASGLAALGLVWARQRLRRRRPFSFV